jgi:hypothetical protein
MTCTESAMGMQAMVMLNISTEANIIHGIRRTITRIVLDAMEQSLSQED